VPPYDAIKDVIVLLARYKKYR